MEEITRGLGSPVDVSESLYKDIKDNKDNYPDYLVGFVGFSCSFGAKWFSGYAKGADRNFAHNGSRSLVKKIKRLSGVEFICCDYSDFNPSGALIYCDPPYVDTIQPYGGSSSFDTVDFWNTIRDWSHNNVVLVSEYTAPPDFEVVVEIPTKTDMPLSSGLKDYRIEKLFRRRNK